MRNLKVAFSIFLVFLLCGCAKVPPSDHPDFPDPVPNLLVTQIDITSNSKDETLVRHYTSVEKLSAVLGFLHAPEVKSASYIATPNSTGQTLTIVLHYSTGKNHVYYQSGGCYWKDSGSNWKWCDASFGIGLRRYLLHTPGDK
jgi:hypothetical protein